MAFDERRADWLDGIDTADSTKLEAPLRDRVRLRRAGVWAAVAFDKSRFQEPPQRAALRAVDELAAVDPAALSEGDKGEYAEAAIRVGAVRWAAANAAAALGRLQIQLQAGEPGQTCVRLIDRWAKTPSTLGQRCTYGTVWAASVKAMPEGRALALTVQPLDGWSELWVWREDTDGWKLDVLVPQANGPGLGYVEWAGWSPAKRGRLLIVREALSEGRASRRFEVLRADTLAAEKTAAEPRQLAAFGLWADAGWKRETLSLR